MSGICLLSLIHLSYMQPTPDYSDWWTKKEAAALLRCSEKSIERMAARGLIQQASRQVPKRPPAAVYNPIDIRKLADQNRSAAFVVPGSPEPEAPAASTALTSMSAAPVNFIEQLVAAIRTPPASVKDKGWLTLAEAEAYWGLPQSHLRKMIKSCRLEAIKIRSWYVRRRSLEEL